MRLSLGGSCPECGQQGALRQSHAEGVWEGKILPWIGLRPFRCLSCGVRIIGLQGKVLQGDVLQGNTWQGNGPHRSRDSAEAEAASQRLAASDDSAFQELITELRDAEARMGLSSEGPKIAAEGSAIENTLAEAEAEATAREQTVREQTEQTAREQAAREKAAMEKDPGSRR